MLAKESGCYYCDADCLGVVVVYIVEDFLLDAI